MLTDNIHHIPIKLVMGGTIYYPGTKTEQAGCTDYH